MNWLKICPVLIMEVFRFLSSWGLGWSTIAGISTYNTSRAPRTDTVCRNYPVTTWFNWCRQDDSNTRPTHYKHDDLPAELWPHAEWIAYILLGWRHSRFSIRLLWRCYLRIGTGWWNHLFLAPESVNGRVLCVGQAPTIQSASNLYRSYINLKFQA